MTDNEIIKAAELCWNSDMSDEHTSCKDLGCPLHRYCIKDIHYLEKACLDLFNRNDTRIAELTEEIKSQKAEIERYKSGMLANAELSKQLYKELKTAKSKVIKEFAERLKTLLLMPGDIVVGRMVYTDEIDNLVKEMVGE